MPMLILLPLLAACASAECTAPECKAIPQPASMLQVESRRSKHEEGTALEGGLSASDIEKSSPFALLDLVQQISNQRVAQAPDANTTAAPDAATTAAPATQAPATTEAPDAATTAAPATQAPATTEAPATDIFGLIKKVVDKILDELIAKVEDEQKTLSAANTAVRQCGHNTKSDSGSSLLQIAEVQNSSSGCHGSCDYAEPVDPASGLPWWAHCCEAEFPNAWRGTHPPGGGTHFGKDPVTGQDYKACGNDGEAAWATAAHGKQAVCCSGNPEGRSAMGDCTGVYAGTSTVAPTTPAPTPAPTPHPVCQEPESVTSWHHAHVVCRNGESILAADMKKKCDAVHAHAVSLGPLPEHPDMDQHETVVHGWRAYFKVVAPIFFNEHETFTTLDAACIQANNTWIAKRNQCNTKQAAYEASTCTFVENGCPHSGGIEECLTKTAPHYNQTIQLLASEEKKNVAEFTALKRILCYVKAHSKSENVQEATHGCHALVVDNSDVRFYYPGWPVMPRDLSDTTKMYPCGKVWKSWAYGALPQNAPATECTKCPNMADLSGGGSSFVRWGALSCPDPSELLYPGIAAGSGHAQHGNGANILCLVEDPSDAPATNTGNNNHAILYGVQYYDLYAGTANNHQDAGCATCSFSGTTYTMWGSTQCQAGHIELYTGNVLSSHHGHDRSEWVCVDSERRPHFKSDAANHEGVRWHLAEYDCGSLPCGPFADAMEVACAQCGIPDESKAVYTRWGHDECGDDSTLVYAGAASGAQHNSRGGGYNGICVTMNPSEAPDKADGAQNHARLYGTEYESHYMGSNRNHDQDASCAVCAYNGRATYNAWGTTECGQGHTRLYQGNVLGDHHGHWRAEWQCVDEAQKGHAQNNAGNNNGVLWYQAEYECGSLPCGPYQENKEVACAMCGVADDAGAVFTRWGHTECPTDSKLVYEGVVAGGHHGHRGGGANPLCLTSEPRDAPTGDNAGNHNHAMLYGAEYDDAYGGAPAHTNWDAGCAVCAYEGAATYDVWGKVSCQKDHQVLYVGNVMAGHHGQHKFNYVCVDEERKPSFNSNNGDNNHARWYTAEYECGSIPCGPYDTNKEAACAKCGMKSSGFQTACSGFTSPPLCPRSRCEWSGGVCKSACKMSLTNTSCSTDTCQWDYIHALCQEPCLAFTSVDECPTSRCLWNGDNCGDLGSDSRFVNDDEWGKRSEASA